MFPLAMFLWAVLLFVAAPLGETHPRWGAALLLASTLVILAGFASLFFSEAT